MSKGSWILGAALVVPFLAGCPESDGIEIVRVEGIVTMEGKPMDKISLRFIPIGMGPESMALTDDQGHFVLHTMSEKPVDGAVVGLHKVVIIDTSIYTKPFRGRASETEDLTEGKSPRIAMKYSLIHNTQMEVSITKETKTLEVKVDPFDPNDPLAPGKPPKNPPPETPYER